MAKSITCDVVGCKNEATPLPWGFKGLGTLDMCPDHRNQLSKTASKTAPKEAKARKSGAGRKPMDAEKKALYAAAKKWAIEKGLIDPDRRGQVSAAIVTEFEKATEA